MASKKKPTKDKGTIEKFLIKKAREEVPDPETEVLRQKIQELKARISILMQRKNKVQQISIRKENRKILREIVEEYMLEKIEKKDLERFNKKSKSIDPERIINSIHDHLKFHELGGYVSTDSNSMCVALKLRYCGQFSSCNYTLRVSRKYDDDSNISYKLLGYDLPSSINIQKIMKESVHDGSYSTAIHLIAKSCQAFHIRKLEMIKFQEKYGKHPNVNIFFTTDYQLIEIMLPLLPELTEAITVKITLKYHPFGLRPYECSIKPNFPYQVTDNGLQDLKQQFRVFKNNDLLTAFESSTDPEAELKYHWNSENVEGDYHMSLLPVFPPIGYKYSVKYDKLVKYDEKTSGDSDAEPAARQPVKKRKKLLKKHRVSESF